MPDLRKVLQDPCCILRKLLAMGAGRWLPDEPYLRLNYFAHFGRKPDLKNPKTFNEKLQWLKLYDRKPEYTAMVDKYEAKRYVAERIGEEYIIPTYGVWDSVEEIDFDALPDKFVLKCTHDCGGLVICRDKASLDIPAAKKKLAKSLAFDYYKWGREWPYKDVPRRIIAERFMGNDLKDYKLFCFNGRPEITLVCSDRFTDTGLCEDFFDRDWNRLDLRRPKHGNSLAPIEKPVKFAQMQALAAELSRDMPFLRVDFYEIGGCLYFGEMTFFPASGFEGFEPREWDSKLGNMVTLPAEK